MLWFLSILAFVILVIIVGLRLGIPPRLHTPEFPSEQLQLPERKSGKDGLFYTDKGTLRKNRYGLYELYVEGDAFNRGLHAGVLSKELIDYQEEVFIEKINEALPGKGYRQILHTLIAWFNRNLHKHIRTEFLHEIYGISRSVNNTYNNVGPAYQRILNYHAAHDIGHMVSSYNLVGCTSFAAWGKHTHDSGMVVGRNFDFYFNDNFSKNKIVEFVAPENGHKFAFITWGGMTGAVSGMNEKGLCVTINAGIVELAWHTGTPVSLLAREMLQFAETIDEAVKIADERKVFVSESFLIVSAADKQAVILEKTPSKTGIVTTDTSLITCTNHAQSEKLKDLKKNHKTKLKATGYRAELLKQLLEQENELDANTTSSILRNTSGLNNEELGLGNEMAINQLIAHHSIIFMPEKKIIWVSTPPNVLGAYVAYDLNSVFDKLKSNRENIAIDTAELEIPADNFIQSTAYTNFERYHKIKNKHYIFGMLKQPIPDTTLNELIALNPNFYEPYLIKANQHYIARQWELAIASYEKALTKPVTEAIRIDIQKKIDKCKKKLN